MSVRALLTENVTPGQTIAKNVLWLFVGQLLNRGLNFIAVAYAARVLGAGPFGALAFAFAFVLLAFTFSDLGIGALIVREYDREDDEGRRRLLGTFWYLKLGLVALSAVAAAIAFGFLQTPVSPALFWLILGVVAADVIRDFFTAAARAIERGTIESAVLIADGLMTALFGILFLRYTGTVEGLAAGYLLAGVLACLLCVILVWRRDVPLFVRPDWSRAGALMRTIWPFALAAIIGISFVQADILLLGWLRGADAAGLYAPGARIVQILFVLPTLIGAAILPALARAVTAADRGGLLREALSFMLLIGLPVFVGGALLAGPLLTALYGPAFSAGGASFAILLAMFLVYACVILLDHALLSANLQVKNFQYTLAAATANVILALLLIPRWGIVGAAAASLLAQGMNLAVTALLVRRACGGSFPPMGDTVRYLAATGVMSLVILGLGNSPVWAVIPLGATTYGLCLVALRARLLRSGLALLRG